MIPAGPAHLLLPLIVAISILLMLIRPKGIAEVYWVGGGVLLLAALRLVPLGLVAGAVAKGMDVYLFLIGMMLLSELAKEHGVFDWLAAIAVRGAGGSCARLFALVYGVGTMVTIFMSNDATAVVLTPAILAAVRRARAEPLPYLFACALIANAASFVLPISNPANLVVFHTGMPPLGRWLLWFTIPSVLSIVATYGVARFVFRQRLRTAIEREVETHSLKNDGKLVLAGLAVMVLVLLVASSLKKDLGLPACLAALAITAEQARARDKLGNPVAGSRTVRPGRCHGKHRRAQSDPNVVDLGANARSGGRRPGRRLRRGRGQQSGQQSSPGADCRQHFAGRARPGSDRPRGSDWCGPGAEPVGDWFAGDDSLATCLA
jgi:hypothetical protein